MAIVRIDDEGRVALPHGVMAELGLRPGDGLRLEVSDGTVVLSMSSKVTVTAAGSDISSAINRKNLDTPVRSIKGVGPKMAELLARKNIITVEDALYHLPIRYEDRRQFRNVKELRPGGVEVFCAEVLGCSSVAAKGGRRFFEVVVGDGSGTVVLKWFRCNLRYMKGIWQPGKRGIFAGELVRYGTRFEIHHPEVEWVKAGTDLAAVMAADPVNFGRTVPVYPLTEGLQQKVLRKVMKTVVDSFAPAVETGFPPDLLQRRALVAMADALREVHFPGAETEIKLLNSQGTHAHRTLVFEEFFFLQLGLALKKQGVCLEEGIPFKVTHTFTRPLLKLLPFSLTAAQKRVMGEIKNDMMGSRPMHRLVQGDVGSGKTVVALLAALLAVENGCQVAIMAPTEILAEQHYLNIHRLCDRLGISVMLLTSRIKGKERTGTLAAIASGMVQIVIGTHAVIQDKVEFSRLGLGIVDEQHRFGVLQRGLLKKKGLSPHILVMTATPIPRTLAMTVFGDLSLSVIDELPPGRTPVATKIYAEQQRNQVYRLIRQEVNAGRQAYIIYPLVEESEKSDLRSATQMADHLAAEIFPDLRIGLLHGRMKPEEKEDVMASFKSRDIDVLVATTVIEVGIDVPNATVMVIEHADRFGLSQLHQLRGRVGRGSSRSHCILLTGGNSFRDHEPLKRLQVMVETTDGFRIAEADLSLRGPGDFLGTRQAGLPDFRVACLLRDGRILEEARQEAFALIESDPALSAPEHAPLRIEVARRWKGRLELAGIA